MRTKLAVVIAAGGLLLAAGPVRAHHAFAAEFDVNKPIKLQGTLTKWEMVNPHSWFHIDVKGPDGKVIAWMVEGGSPNQLIRMGVTKNTVPAGTELADRGLPGEGRDQQSRRPQLRAGRWQAAVPRRLRPRRWRGLDSAGEVARTSRREADRSASRPAPPLTCILIPARLPGGPPLFVFSMTAQPGVDCVTTWRPCETSRAVTRWRGGWSVGAGRRNDCCPEGRRAADAGRPARPAAASGATRR